MQNYLDAARKRMRTAGADAFNRGKPCVPGLDILWERELEAKDTLLALDLALAWRLGWKAQAALVERVRGAA
jgi:hypothetical protein